MAMTDDSSTTVTSDRTEITNSSFSSLPEDTRPEERIINDLNTKLSYVVEKELDIINLMIKNSNNACRQQEKIDWAVSVYEIVERTCRYAAKSCGLQRLPSGSRAFNLLVKTATGKLSQYQLHKSIGKHLVQELKHFMAEYENIVRTSKRSDLEIRRHDRHSFEKMVKMLLVGIPIETEAVSLESQFSDYPLLAELSGY